MQVQTHPGSYAEYAPQLAAAIGRRTLSHLEAQNSSISWTVSTACVHGCVQLFTFAAGVILPGATSQVTPAHVSPRDLLDALPAAEQLEGVQFDVLQQQGDMNVRPAAAERVRLISMDPVCFSSGPSNSSSISAGDFEGGQGFPLHLQHPSLFPSHTTHSHCMCLPHMFLP